MLNELSQLREEIDSIDAQLLSLLNRRAQCALSVGELKKANHKRDIRDSDREQAIHNRLKTINTGPLTNDQILECYSLFIRQSRDLQESL